MKSIFTIIFLFIASSFYAQEKEMSPQIEWGFVVGLSYGQLAGVASPSDTAMAFFNSVETQAVVGVHAGIAVTFPINSKWEFEPQFVANMLGPRVVYERKNGRLETFRVQPLRIDLPLHIHYKNGKENAGLSVGIKPLFGLSELGNSRPGLLEYDVMGDIGVRRKLHMGVGSYWLEILFSSSLLNIASPNDNVYDEWFSELRRQEITLRLHFM
jgi:hypothetical protein